MFASLTRAPYEFQLLQPIGGFPASPFHPGANPGPYPYDTTARKAISNIFRFFEKFIGVLVDKKNQKKE